MREIVTTLASVRSEQSHNRAPRPASSHGGTLCPPEECSRVEGKNHDFSACQCVVGPSGPYSSSAWSNASESTQALPASFAPSRLQYDGVRSESIVGKGLDHPQMDVNTIWQTNSSYQSKDDEIKDEKLAHKSQSTSRIVNPGPMAHSGPTVLWIENEVSEDSKSERHTLRILVILHSDLTFHSKADSH